ncbi:MAG: hypothetical protein GY817_01365 [bacterium]|nr:hypothetical protein [bacterium]
MAISKIKKLSLFFLKEQTDAVFQFLQTKKVLELKKENLEKFELSNYAKQSQNFSLYLSKLKKVINVLSRLDKTKKTFMQKLSDRITIEESDFLEPRNVQNLCYNLTKKLNLLDELDLKQIEFSENILDIKPWISIKTDVDALIASKWTRTLAAILPIAEYTDFYAKSIIKPIEIIEVSRTAKEVYFTVTVLFKELEKVKEEIAKYGKILHWEALEGSPLEIYKKLEKCRAVYSKKSQNLQRKIRKNIKYLSEFKVEYDRVFNEWLKDLEKNNTFFGKHIAVITGWIREENVDDLNHDLEEKLETIYLLTEEPDSSDEVPIAFDNAGFFEPFEIVTDLYGRPKYHGGIDPTPFLAPFFILFFGICLGDAGYGAFLIILSCIFLWLFRDNKFAKKSLKLLLFMGCSSLLIGLITGTFFGNLVKFLPESMDFLKNILAKFVLLNPLGDQGALIFLGTSLAIGYLQICFGIILKSWMFIKNRDFKGLILDGLSIFGVQLALMPITLYYVLGIKLLPANIMFGFVILLLMSMGIIAYKEWTANEGIVIKLFWCLYGNYAVITGNFLSDTLSYARLFALGLSGGLLGLAVNEISGVFRPIPFVGVVFMIIVMVIGHLFNLAISFMGAFVHTCRLQYLEFFTKFFESGGREFKPFKRENKYTILS